jgi:L-cysteate sulfo-lyase
MHLARFPRVHLVQAPTPLEPLPRLSAHLGGPTLWIKRDDCTGLATGGNKTRKLEFLVGEALAEGADTLITQGATQSNHVRQTAAAAARFGLRCEALLERRIDTDDRDYRLGGNVFLDGLLGAVLHDRPGGTDMAAALEDLAAALRARGARPYVIPGGGSNPTGALGYVAAGLELLHQANEQRLRVDTVVTATGSTGTQSGLVASLTGANSGIPVLGISVRAPRPKQEDAVYTLSQATAGRLGIRGGIPRSAIVVDDRFVGPGYGLPTPGMIEAVTLFARLEGILLDPVYTGKGAAGLIGLIREGRFAKGENVVFLHTGGSAGLFAYQEIFRGA